MLHYAIASSLRVHGHSCWNGPVRSLDIPESQGRIGFKPLFCPRHRTAFLKFPPFFGDRQPKPFPGYFPECLDLSRMMIGKP
jgi:hypothetical protein